MRKIAAFALVLALICTIAACGEATEPVNPAPENGGLVYDGSTESETLTFKFTPGSGDPFTIPTATKNDGFEFIGWCMDAELTTFLPQSFEITSDLTLYAYWAPAP
jgi:hypothetical protein